jgi:hypothetical protein
VNGPLAHDDTLLTYRGSSARAHGLESGVPDRGSLRAMALDIPLKCQCGTLRGTALGVSANSGCRVVCYCTDCQAFARFLARPDIMDPWGGTDLFQMAPARLRLTAGAAALSCVRLSEKGMHRWYCGECKTPVGNTLGPGVPFVGVARAFMDHESDGRSRDEVLGKPIGYIKAKSATGSLPVSVRDASVLPAVARTIRLLATWWLTGAGRPSPFFPDGTRAPRAVPRILSVEERRQY